jgi:hypothetical protein
MILSIGGNEFAITSPPCYLISVIVAVVLIRVILVLFKVLAMKDGEHRPDTDKPDPITNYSFKNLFRIGFSGFCGNATTRDYLLPALIGFAELAAYPVLFETNQLSVIGGWLALKTAGQWSVWKTSRTAFNRFLLGNLLTIGLSFFWLSRFVTATAG